MNFLLVLCVLIAQQVVLHSCAPSSPKPPPALHVPPRRKLVQIRPPRVPSLTYVLKREDIAERLPQLLKQALQHINTESRDVNEDKNNSAEKELHINTNKHNDAEHSSEDVENKHSVDQSKVLVPIINLSTDSSETTYRHAVILDQYDDIPNEIYQQEPTYQTPITRIDIVGTNNNANDTEDVADVNVVSPTIDHDVKSDLHNANHIIKKFLQNPNINMLDFKLVDPQSVSEEVKLIYNNTRTGNSKEEENDDKVIIDIFDSSENSSGRSSMTKKTLESSLESISERSLGDSEECCSVNSSKSSLGTSSDSYKQSKEKRSEKNNISSEERQQETLSSRSNFISYEDSSHSHEDTDDRHTVPLNKYYRLSFIFH